MGLCGIWALFVGLVLLMMGLLKRHLAVQEAHLTEQIGKLGFDKVDGGPWPSLLPSGGADSSTIADQPDAYSPGWYPELARPGHWRYFDGHQWTTLTR